MLSFTYKFSSYSIEIWDLAILVTFAAVMVWNSKMAGRSAECSEIDSLDTSNTL